MNKITLTIIYSIFITIPGLSQIFLKNDYYKYSGEVLSCNEIEYTVKKGVNNKIEIAHFINWNGQKFFNNNRKIVYELKQSFITDSNYLKYCDSISYTYNSCGSLNKIQTFDKYKNLKETVLYKKEVNSEILKVQYYYDSDTFAFAENYFYKNGILNKQVTENKNDTIFYHYDLKGNLIELEITPKTVFIYKNDSHGYPIVEYQLGAKGSQIIMAKSKYNKKGLIEKQQIYQNGKVVRTLLYSYFYDNFGNWIKRIEFESDLKSPVSIVIREFKYAPKD